MRTIIDLPAEQIEALSGLCRREHISRAEAIRRAVQKLLTEAGPDPSHEPDIAFGIWKGKFRDGRKHIEKLRTEWDRA